MTVAPASSPPSIRVLPPEVSSRIAAGEVIERPVSIVRELLDNAIDAGATRITVEIEDGGIALIRVTDNGRGISPEQVELAFERHATSKIAGLSDLGHVHTLGFRGEALPSIAAAADVDLLTRAAGEPVAVQATLVEARVVRRSARPAPEGTSFSVRELFGRLPARRKFLGSIASEARAITTLITHYALAYPEISFQFGSHARRVLTTSGDGQLRHAFAAVYGADNAAQMLDVLHEEDGLRISGLAGPSSLHRGNRAAISVFVNGRWVQSRPLIFSIVDAYQSQLPVGRHPIAAIAIGVNDDDVDVNVHPAKAEVRFRDERAVGRVVRHAVTRALEASGPVRWFPPAAAPAADEAGASPVAAGEVSLRARLDPVQALRAPQPTQARMDWRPGTSATPPGADGPAPTQREVLPLLRVVGQMAATYVVAEGPDGMYLIDQHAAHERVAYDRILVAREAAAAPASQPLLEPVLLELDVPRAAALEEHREHLASLGLELEAFGELAYLVRAVPAGMGDTDIVAALQRFLDQLGTDRRLADPFSRAAATVACHASVRAGQALALEQMRQLVTDLERTASPRTCPHGRPTLVHVGVEAIERQFGRR
ncbi:MAG: DNA mismatch repair endonuclease MutL [Dehalococcoidia bacterium]